MPEGTKRFVTCVANNGCEVSLERRKIYVALADPSFDRLGLVPIIDESGTEHLFPSESFVEATRPLPNRRATSHTYFHIIGEIAQQETIASDAGIREIFRVRKVYGGGHWQKRKGIAQVQLASGATIHAEVHWYETSGIGKREYSLKRVVKS
jgi:hypothetical protein